MKIKIKCDDISIKTDIKKNNYSFVEEGYDYIISKKSNETIYGYSDKSIIPIKINGIMYFESYGNDVFAVTQLKRIKIKDKLYELERLYLFGFFRINKSTIMNRNHIKKIIPTINMKFYIHMMNNDKLDVTRSYYHRFKEEMNL